MIDRNGFPKELAALPNWVCWRLEPDKKAEGRTTKVPYSPKNALKASSNKPNTWGTLDEALLFMDKYTFTGVGFVFTEESGIVGIDIDHCLDEHGNPNEIAAAILEKLPQTYIEISPSGTGLHIFIRGRLPPGGNKNSQHGVEMYASRRYFTMTGNQYSKSVDLIAENDGALEYIHRQFIVSGRKLGKQSASHPGRPLSDEELLELARSSKDGESFRKLWGGEWQGRYPSQSEADFALCRKLAFWSGRNEAQVDRLFRQSGLFREKWNAQHHANGATYGENTVGHACETTEKCYTPPPKKEAEVFEHGGMYYRNRNQKVYPLTNFIVQPVEMICSDEETQITCDLLTAKGETFRQTLMTSDFSNLQKFKNILNKKTIALSFKGSEGDLELLKEFIYDLDWVRKRGVKALGIYPYRKRLAFVAPDSAVVAGGKEVRDIVQLEKYCGLESDILSFPLIKKEELLELGQLLFNYNEPAKTVPILAWLAGCFIKPHLRRIKVKFPHLFLIGEAGSGKSNTLERIILPVFGRSKVTASAQVTAFTLMRESCSSNIIPQALDEFKPSKLDKMRLHWLYNHFRDSYDWHEGIRGRADQTAVTYDLLAPIVIAGEESADETAIRERSIELLFSKKDLKMPEHKEAFTKLSASTGLLGSFGRSLLDTALQTMPPEVKGWYDESVDLFSKELPTRIVSNLGCAYCGLCLILKLCAAHGLSWSAVFSLDSEACASWLEYAAKEYLLDGGAHNKSVVEQTFEIMARMKLKPGTDFAFENNRKYLCLCLSQVYDRYTRYRRDYAVLGEVLTYAQFRQQLEHSESFVEKNRTKRFGDATKKVWVVDFEKLQRLCDVSGFLQEEHMEDE